MMFVYNEGAKNYPVLPQKWRMPVILFHQGASAVGKIQVVKEKQADDIRLLVQIPLTRLLINIHVPELQIGLRGDFISCPEKYPVLVKRVVGDLLAKVE